MSDTILSNRWIVSYEADNRQKRLKRDTAVTPTVTDSVNALYSALQDQFDELTQLDDGSPMSAQTPTEYTIGIIDTGDDDPWFIDDESVQYLTGGAIQTSSWTRVQDSNTGIVTFTYTIGTDFIATDIGNTITSTEGDSGTLLDFWDTGSTKYAIVRPDSDAVGNNWDSATGTITVVAGSAASVTQATAAVTGEKLWANIVTIGTIAENSHIYVKQTNWDFESSELLTGYEDNALRATGTEGDWWGDGQIDILIKVKDPISVATGEDLDEIDQGFVTVYARQQSKTYSHFITSLASGGRTAIPLSTGTDLDNQYGNREMVLTTASGDFTVGEVIEDDSDATIQGVITSNTGTAPNTTIQYYLVGDPLVDFTGATGGFTGATSTETATAVAPSNVNAATTPATDVTITFGADETYDVDEDDTTENYSIVIDCSDETLDTMQQRIKFLTRRGETADLDAGAQTIEGQFYIGTDYVLVYNAETGSVTEGAEVQQITSQAKGTVTGHNATDNILMLRDSRDGQGSGEGAFDLASNVEIDGSNYVTMGGGSVEVVTPNVASPFGTYAGGTFFGARGVVLSNVAAADATNYQLTDDDGNVVNPPNKVTVTVANTRDEDRVAIFRTTGGIINKDEYAATAQAAGVTTLVTGTSIVIDTPGKTAGGTVILVGDDEDTEYPIRYDSWSGSTFTLSNNDSGTTDDTGGTTSETNLHEDSQNFLTTVQVGDLVRNVTAAGISWVTAVVDDDNLTIAPPISGQAAGDTYALNVLPITADTDDNVYVPILWSYEDTGTDGAPGTESSILTYDSDISVLVIARNSNSTASTTTPMLPYSATATITSTGLTNNVIRSQDAIKT